MELRHLTYFIAVAQKLNFSRAAESLHVAQPAISQQIRALEEQLGVRLFDRMGKRIALTRAGEVLLPHAYGILAAVELAANEVRELGELTRGNASLGAPPTVSTHMLPSRLTQFHSLFPGLEVSLREAGTESLLSAVAEGQLDLAIVASDGLPSVVERAPFLDEDYVLAVSVMHPLSRQRTVRLADLAGEPFILFPAGYRLREVTLAACRKAGFEPKVALDGGAMQSALEFVAAGLGVALVPELALTDAPNIRRVVIEDQTLRRSLSLVWRTGHYLSPAARALRDFLLQEKPLPGA
jgi:LysR family transcriptional regulator, transcription activator of glutamate synthase operon